VLAPKSKVCTGQCPSRDAGSTSASPVRGPRTGADPCTNPVRPAPGGAGVRHHFQDRRDGHFVDVGADQDRDSSQTHYLENRLRRPGVAIEPVADFEDSSQKHRPRTQCLPGVGSEVSHHSAEPLLLENLPMVAP